MTYGDWQDIEANAVDTSAIQLTHRAEVADPQAEIDKLAERIAKRAGYPEADKECLKVARMMLKEISCVDRLLQAYTRLETPKPNEEKTWFVSTAEGQTPFWQVRQVVSEAKRGAKKKAGWMSGYEQYVNR